MKILRSTKTEDLNAIAQRATTVSMRLAVVGVVLAIASIVTAFVGVPVWVTWSIFGVMMAILAAMFFLSWRITKVRKEMKRRIYQ